MRKKLLLLFFFIVGGTATYGTELPDSMQKVLDKASTDTARIRILLKASNTGVQQDPDLGTRYAMMALSLSQKSGNRALVAKSYYRLGTNAYIAKTMDKSLAWFVKAATLNDSLHDLKGMAMSYSAIGDVIGDEGNGKKSIEYYSKAKTYFIDIKDTEHVIYMDMAIAGTLGSMNLNDSALAYTLSILPAAEKTGNNTLISMITANIGAIYKQKGEYAKALEYFLKALKCFERQGDFVIVAQSYGNIGDTYMLMGDYPNAEKYVGLQYESYKKAKSQIGILQAMKQFGNIFMQKKDYQQAAEWYKKAIEASDSFFKADVTKQVAEMQTKYETEKKDKALILQNAKLDRQQLIINGSIAFLVLILAASLVLFINYRKINKLSKALSVQKVELQELNTVKDKLFSAISHDLRSPLGRITNMLYMMQRGGMDAEKLKSRTSDFLNAMNQTMQMLDNLLYWATGQMKGLNINKTQINLWEITDENLELMKGEAELKNIELVDTVDKSTMAHADLNMVRLVMRNLVSNAIKFTPEGGTVEISSVNENNMVQISVSDTGIGMDKETLNALLANKQIKSRMGTGTEKGFGLGLQLCKDFIEKNGGKLDIKSETDKGSVFSFSLPVGS